MSLRFPVAALAAALATLAATPAQAVVCYTLLDRNDNIEYRGTIPPVDLSDQGAAAREKLRKNGEQLVWMEFDSCPAIVYFTGAAGSKNLTVDQIVAGFPAMMARPTSAAPEAPSAPPAGASTAPLPRPAASGPSGY